MAAEVALKPSATAAVVAVTAVAVVAAEAVPKPEATVKKSKPKTSTGDIPVERVAELVEGLERP